jgi:hypothetical protein
MDDEEVTIKKWEVFVRVDFNYTVEAETKEEAEQQGWAWEDYRQFSEVHEIKVEESDEDYVL